MATGWPIEARQALLLECWEVIKDNERIAEASGAREDWFHLTQAILEDDVFETSCRARVTAALKSSGRSGLWPKVLLFMVNSDSRCADCGHGTYNHGGWGEKAGTKPCDHRPYTYNNGQHVQGQKCKCKAFVRRPMK